jgi:hypothetical protein
MLQVEVYGDKISTFYVEELNHIISTLWTRFEPSVKSCNKDLKIHTHATDFAKPRITSSSQSNFRQKEINKERKRGMQQTPEMAEGPNHYVWSTNQLLTFRITNSMVCIHDKGIRCVAFNKLMHCSPRYSSKSAYQSNLMK